MIKVHIHQFKEDAKPVSMISLPVMPQKGDLFADPAHPGKFHTVSLVWYLVGKRGAVTVHVEIPNIVS